MMLASLNSSKTRQGMTRLCLSARPGQDGAKIGASPRDRMRTVMSPPQQALQPEL